MKKAVFCALISAFMLMSAGCGRSEVNEEIKVPPEPEKAATTTVQETTAPAVTTEAKTEPPTEASTAPDSELFAYYDDLAAEWEKTGDTTMSSNNIVSGYLLGTHDGNAYILRSSNEYYQVYSVDKDNNGEMLFDLCDYGCNINSMLYCCNGYFYAEDIDSTLYMFDSTGALVASANVGKTCNTIIEGVSPEGDVLLYNFNNGTANGKVYCYSDKLSVVREIPTPKYEVEHGLTEDYGIGFMKFNYGYGHRVYLENSNIYLDCETLEWVNYEDGGSVSTSEVKGDSADRLLGGGRCVGRYLLLFNGLYDMETNEWLFRKIGASRLPMDYHGGDFSVSSGNNGTCYYRIAADDSEDVIIKRFDEGTSVTGFNVIDNERYFVFDKYGIFIHTFEKGDSEEIQAVLFDK